MGLTVLSAAGWPGDPFARSRAPKGRASRPEAVRVLSPDAQEALTRLLDGGALDGLPMLSSWDPVGPPRYLRGTELDQVVDEAGRVLAAPSTPDDARAALAGLVALVDDAPGRTPRRPPPGLTGSNPEQQAESRWEGWWWRG